MERSPNLPDPTRVAERAKEILSALKADPEFPAFEAASLKYDEGWSCFAGAPVISKYDQETDKTPLLEEGLRALSLKAAVYEMTGDEQTSEIPVAIPLAWGGPPERYWIDHTEAQRRLGILRTKYEEAGFLKMGQAHVIDFGEPVAV